MTFRWSHVPKVKNPKVLSSSTLTWNYIIIQIFSKYNSRICDLHTVLKQDTSYYKHDHFKLHSNHSLMQKNLLFLLEMAVHWNYESYTQIYRYWYNHKILTFSCHSCINGVDKVHMYIWFYLLSSHLLMNIYHPCNF